MLITFTKVTDAMLRLVVLTVGHSSRFHKLRQKIQTPGVRFSKDPKTLLAPKAIRKTPTRLFCKAGLFICCKGYKN